ncbi:hypothetical protein MMB17_03945 [Methylobacterium organophilum]|uniref:hypothetical protein n=1 Tax=Methylobacterium organophilum TaxID=410 RepID=UPI001F14035A|nr:hypothetical protein [Methylobacterium organophilum]UMY18500.1 hypothetical protein MMB17_03945 [Methylobacterium organophilum]
MSSAFRFMKIRLGVPLSYAEVRIFRENMWKRYTGKSFPDEGDGTQAGAALLYLDRIVDRLINKARGILPFNSILIVIANLERALDAHKELINASLVSLVVSTVLLINLFWVHWGDVDHYASAAREFGATVRIIWVRSMIMQISIFLSLLGLVLLTISGVDYYSNAQGLSFSATLQVPFNFSRLNPQVME